ncbi:protein-arginine kinase activator protein McsA [Sporomusaceae bacterium BoRhaA]|uniref:hypothetical protein n=1 Tax=Pelorhabdus rhamnosifermentans TaxID=2772457 RepID=UPI001C060B0A|nr:hypothetical protein [Pelorhabdus rhamnosifermentans]MBU2704193.1 protein-arginine kinase activator protein McsA [Pelorhabdus rhamnosifermentans]
MIEYSRPEKGRLCSSCGEDVAGIKISIVQTQFNVSNNQSFYLCEHCARKLEAALLFVKEAE